MSHPAARGQLLRTTSGRETSGSKGLRMAAANCGFHTWLTSAGAVRSHPQGRHRVRQSLLVVNRVVPWTAFTSLRSVSPMTS